MCITNNIIFVIEILDQMDIDIDNKLAESEFWSQGDLSQLRCFVCRQKDTDCFNIFETKTCRDYKLAVYLATALQIDIVTNAVGNEVIHN
jgi:hypothetical protein